MDCDLSDLARPDAATLEALARLQLIARRLGRRIVFREACGELRELVSFAGLGDALPCEGDVSRLGSGLEPGRESEEREQALGVQEEAEPGDPTA